MSDSLNAFQQRIHSSVTDAQLSPKQKNQFLALEAEAHLPYMAISAPVAKGMEEGALFDMFEGHAQCISGTSNAVSC